MKVLMFSVVVVLSTVLGGDAQEERRRCFDCHGHGQECATTDNVAECLVHETTCSTIVTEIANPQNSNVKSYNVVRQCGRGPLAYKAWVAGASYAHSAEVGTRCVTTTQMQDDEFEADESSSGRIVECWCQSDECNNQPTVNLPDGTEIYLAPAADDTQDHYE